MRTIKYFKNFNQTFFGNHIQLKHDEKLWFFIYNCNKIWKLMVAKRGGPERALWQTQGFLWREATIGKYLKKRYFVTLFYCNMHDWTVVRLPLKEITWQKLFAISLQALCWKLNLCQSCRMLSLALKPLAESPLRFSRKFFPKRAKNDVFLH